MIHFARLIAATIWPGNFFEISSSKAFTIKEKRCWCVNLQNQNEKHCSRALPYSWPPVF